LCPPLRGGQRVGPRCFEASCESHISGDNMHHPIFSRSSQDFPGRVPISEGLVGSPAFPSADHSRLMFIETRKRLNCAPPSSTHLLLWQANHQKTEEVSGEHPRQKPGYESDVWTKGLTLPPKFALPLPGCNVQPFSVGPTDHWLRTCA
jgi:hypothetical protein